MSYIYNDKITYKDSASNDAFGRLRVSNVYTLFDSKQLSHPHNEYYDLVSDGGNSEYVLTGSSSNLIVSGGTGSYVIRQTKQRFNYQTGKSLLVLLTGVFSSETNVIKRVGIFDSGTVASYTPHNGIYFENSGSTLSFNISYVGNIRQVFQSEWNIDKLDGTGKSNITLDISKSQIIVIDAEWLGVGRVRVGFNIDGITYYVHEFLNSNNIVGVYTQYINLPIRYEIRSEGGDGSLEQICSSVSSEGGLDPTGVYRTLVRETSLTINNGINRPLLAIRLKDESIMGGVLLENLSVLGINKSDYRYIIKIYSGDDLVNVNGTPTTWENVVFTEMSNSFIEYKNDFDTTYTVNETSDNGITIFGGFLSDSASSIINQIKNTLSLGAKITGERDVVVVEIKSLSANDEYYGSLIWREI